MNLTLTEKMILNVIIALVFCSLAPASGCRQVLENRAQYQQYQQQRYQQQHSNAVYYR